MMFNIKTLYRAIIGCLAFTLLVNTTACTILDPVKQQTHQDLDPMALHQSLRANIENLECLRLDGDTEYRLGAGDHIKITVFGEENLTGKYNLQDSGTLNIPLIGETMLSGCSIRQAEHLLYKKFTDGYLVNPSITVSVSKYSPFYIIGEVREPGKYDYVINMNVLEAVAMSGGFTYRANKKIARVLTNKNNDQAMYKNLPVEQKIYPGDVIIIKERFF